jgi:hypothetical protein
LPRRVTTTASCRFRRAYSESEPFDEDHPRLAASRSIAPVQYSKALDQTSGIRSMSSQRSSRSGRAALQAALNRSSFSCRLRGAPLRQAHEPPEARLEVRVLVLVPRPASP